MKQQASTLLYLPGRGADWVERYRTIWEERFGRLDEYLRELEDETKERG